jgi:peptidoglycan-associated lipoprotein
MKSLHIALFSLAAVAAGCTPQYPPSDYGAGSRGPVSIGDTIGGGENGDLLNRPKDTNTAAFFKDGEWNPAAVFTTIYFGFDKYGVQDTERTKLNAILEQAKNAHLIVAGYTDHFGTDLYNQSLSDKRAQSVKNYLVSLGIPDANIEIQAFGKHYSKPTGNRDQVAGDRRAVVVNADYKP